MIRIEDSNLLPSLLASDGRNLFYTAFSREDNIYHFYQVDLAGINVQLDLKKTKLQSTTKKPLSIFFKNNILLWQWSTDKRKQPNGIMMMDVSSKTTSSLLENEIRYLKGFDGNVILCLFFDNDNPRTSYFTISE
jgi:hypothetical protein